MQLDFRVKQLHWWTQGCSSRLFDPHRRERFQVIQRFAWGIKLELYDESRVLKARLRERLSFRRRFDLTLFDHAELPRLAATIELVPWFHADFTLSDGRSVAIRDAPNGVAIRCGELVLHFELFDSLIKENDWANSRLRGTGVEDEALAVALMLPVLASRP